MKLYRNLKISAKLIIGFIIVVIIAAVVGIVGIVNIQKMQRLDSDMYQRHTSTLDDMAVVMQSYQKERVILRDMILKDASTLQESKDKVTTLDETIKNSMANFEKGIVAGAVQENYDTLEKAITNFQAYRDSIIDLISSNQSDAAVKSMYSDGAEINEAVDTATTNLLQLKVQLSKESSEANTSAGETATFVMIIIIAVGAIIAMVLGISISRIISIPVNRMVEAADKLALGDVNVNVEANTKDEIGKLAESLNRMIDNIRGQAKVAEQIASGDLTVDVAVKSEHDLLGKKLYELVTKNNEILNNIAAASEQVAAGAKQVSDSSIALSQGATEQASSIEELTASLEEISSQTKINADNASQANELAEVAKANALQGNDQMKEMQKAMEEINISSSNISKIIKVIDEIAFQTNILALNAAVEAARAGQHGKGFAVVAEEVRNLAARSANAAKETTDMIEGSIIKVGAGTKIADETAQALNKIVADVAKAATLVSDIAVASNEQASAIGQINQGILQVSQVVQTNSATSEESAAASEELSGQAELLKDSVGKYKLKKTRQYSKFDELNPDVMSMLDDLSEKKRSGQMKEDFRGGENSGKRNIILSDKEFGKY